MRIDLDSKLVVYVQARLNPRTVLKENTTGFREYTKSYFLNAYLNEAFL